MPEFCEIEQRTNVVARTTPDRLLLFVDGLMKLGRTVAVVSDGTNAAPAMKRADVGCAEGIGGTDVCKAASDVVICDDSFFTVVHAIRQGRIFRESARKAIQQQATQLAVILAIELIGAAATGNSPLSDIQLLWVAIFKFTSCLVMATDP